MYVENRDKIPPASLLPRSSCCLVGTGRDSVSSRALRRTFSYCTTLSIHLSLPNHGQHLVAPPLHLLARIGLQVEAQQRLRVGRPHIEPPRREVDRDAVQMVNLPAERGIVLLDLVHLRRLVLDLAVDLAAAEPRVDWGQQLKHRLAALAHQLQHDHQRDQAGVSVPVIAEVEVSGVFPAEDGVFLAHLRLDERVADACSHRTPAIALDQLWYAARAD